MISCLGGAVDDGHPLEFRVRIGAGIDVTNHLDLVWIPELPGVPALASSLLEEFVLLGV